MPSRPGLRKQSVTTGVGPQTLYTYTASSVDPLTRRPLGYIVVFTDTPSAGIGKNRTKFLDAVRNGFATKRNGKILSQKR
jgi:hypothetical protein